MLVVTPHERSAEIGIFGGSGFYSFDDGHEQINIETPYGDPSAPLMVGDIDGRSVAFLAGHGTEHTVPAHKVNYRANVWAIRAVGVNTLISPFACGSLRRELKPGHLVMVDQLVDRTNNREGTFFDGPQSFHLPFADPYDKPLANIIAGVAREMGITVHDSGTVVVVPGPRFSTRAESKWHSAMGWDLVNMTQAPEAALANEAGLTYAAIGMVTDYDVGLSDDPSIDPVTEEQVFAFLKSNAESMRQLLLKILPQV